MSGLSDNHAREIAGRLNKEGLFCPGGPRDLKRDRYVTLYCEGAAMRERGVAFFRPSPDLSEKEKTALRLGHMMGMP